MANRLCVSDLPWAVIIFVICAVVGCGFGAILGYDYGRDSFAERKEIRSACIAGNDRACEVYAADYGRRIL
ncbi:hypothetical protein [Stenotrophomonas sp. HITSZ_GD]|uniref:hypothetical protein n=1 Tax=Stenotrophomonas sp. HITSZ_GD TaxID=3037248 RepID=UPI00240E63F7|nr:hypothetical protein [Stenotrophomonas sp. HITSZ_GD]